MKLRDFYKNKKVLITGHTGFKGAWMCMFLAELGADVTGYSLEAPTSPSLYELCQVATKVNSVVGDVRDLNHLRKVFDDIKPEIVIHMAAQPIVRESYKNPVYTYAVNVMGTVNVCEIVRHTPSVKSFINVTTDKVYLNREWSWGYRENEELNGFDPYSNSKSCSELVTSTYVNCFFTNDEYHKEYDKTVDAPAVTTCRAGNVIGGGDFATDRIIPDCLRAAEKGEDILVRNPFSIRPYQHVLEPVYVYLNLAMLQYFNPTIAGSYNVGPDDADCIATGQLVEMFCDKWNSLTLDRTVNWRDVYVGGPHEAGFLKLDCSKLKTAIGWHPIWNIETTMEMVVTWYQAYLRKEDMNDVTMMQIRNFLEKLPE